MSMSESLQTAANILAVVLATGFLLWLATQSPPHIDVEIAYNNRNVDEIHKRLSSHLYNLRAGYEKREFVELCRDIQENKLFLYSPDRSVKYYVFVLEKVKENFVNRVHPNPSYIDVTWQDMIKDTDENFISDRYSTDTELINNMFTSDAFSRHGIITYFWVDFISQASVRKVTLYVNLAPYVTPAGVRIDGAVIGIGYNAQNLSNADRIFHYKSPSVRFYSGVLLGVLAIAVGTVSHFGSSFWQERAFLLSVATIVYLIYYLISWDTPSNASNERSKITSINNGISSISFLAGFHIFILTTMAARPQNKLALPILKETIVITCLCLFCLLCATYKVTNYDRIDEIVEIRFSKQLVFNYSVILNFFIVINYLVFSLG